MIKVRRKFAPALLTGVFVAAGVGAVGHGAERQGNGAARGSSRAAQQAQQPKGKKGVTPEQIANVQSRVAVANRILDRLEPEARARGLESGWRRASMETLLPLSLDALRTVEEQAVTFEALSSAISDPGILSIGDTNADLVYTPIVPCRYIDTRNAGGKISGVRGFDLFDDGAVYGGAAACDPTVLFGANENAFGGLAMNITVVDTSAAGAPGFLAVKPTAASPTTSLLNWYDAGVGVQVANMGIATTDQGGALDEFVIQTSGAVHVIADIFGAFLTPEATAVQTTIITTDWSITAGSFNVVATCPAGYSVTGGGWNHGVGSFDGISATQSSTSGNAWRCRGWHTGTAGSTQSGTCEAVCTRIPGR